MAFSKASDLDISDNQVAIALTYGAFGTHLGVIYQPSSGKNSVLHLSWHLRLVSEDLLGLFPEAKPKSAEWVCSKLELPPLAAKVMVGALRKLASSPQSIGYGLNVLAAAGSFNAKGEYSCPAGSDGLTCASFVTTLFADLGFPIIKVNTWQSLPENFKWANQVCYYLARDATPAHVQAVRSNINGLRVRPEEVAATANLPRAFMPSEFAVAYCVAKGAVSFLHDNVPKFPAYPFRPHPEAGPLVL